MLNVAIYLDSGGGKWAVKWKMQEWTLEEQNSTSGTKAVLVGFIRLYKKHLA